MKSLTISLITSLIILSGCGGCSKSGRGIRNKEHALPAKTSGNHFRGKTVVRMEKESDVYKIPVNINGIDMSFIFDTGAGMISISNIEASFLLKQGKISRDDIIGTSNFMDANGDISEGTIIRLKKITIGNRTIYNIEAAVVNNSVAPLLFGQSALKQFGKISINYANSTITFE